MPLVLSDTVIAMGDTEDRLSASDLTALVESIAYVAGEVDVRAVVQRILTEAGRLTDSPDSSVILHNPRRDTLYFAGATGSKAEWLLANRGEFSSEQIPIEGSIAGKVFTTREPVVEQDVAADPKHYKKIDHDVKKVTQSMVCVPLIAAGDALGAMQLLNKRTGPYADRDLAILQHFARQAALAIRNAKLLEDLLAHMGLYASMRDHSAFELSAELKAPARDELLTVLFADMRGFTRLCQALENRERMQEVLNEFLTLLADEVLAGDGTVNKFMGDGLLAIFRGAGHAERAVTSAFRMVERFSGLPERWQDRSNASLDFLDIGIGIATDEVIIGSVGSDQVRDFTVMGTAVNLASALEQRARGGKRILVSQKTLAAVKSVVAESAGPEHFMLKKPDQEVGHSYNCFHLIKLRAPASNRVFISHSHRDRGFVDGELIPALASESIDTWYSKDDVRSGSQWAEAIRDGLEKCDWFAVVVSENAAASEWVRREVDLAISMKKFHGRIVPASIDQTPMSAVSSWLVPIQAFDVSDDTGSLARTLKELMRQGEV